MDLADAGEIEIVSRNIETESAGGGIVGGAAGDDGIVVKEMDVIESEFAMGEMEVGIELLDGLTVGGGVVEMDLTVTVRIGLGTSGLQEKIGGPSDGIVVSGKRLHGGEVGVE
jgi:hypothetical protein